MTLAKAVVTGYVYRNPEKRFTQNNVSVSAFVLNIGDKDEMLRRVHSAYEIIKDDSLDKITRANAIRSVVSRIIFDKSENRLEIHFKLQKSQ